MKKYVQETLNYYREHCDEFIEKTENADMTSLYGAFEKYVDAGGSILDLGCGTGRDSLHFMQEGYDVTAVDGSMKMCEHAGELLGRPVRCMLFSELDYFECFDGVWASASLLHVPKKELSGMLDLISRALRDGGYLYLGFKQGNFEGMRDGKYYSDYTDSELFKMIEDNGKFAVVEYIETEDVRDNVDTDWINVILRKIQAE